MPAATAESPRGRVAANRLRTSSGYRPAERERGIVPAPLPGLLVPDACARTARAPTIKGPIAMRNRITTATAGLAAALLLALVRRTATASRLSYSIQGIQNSVVEPHLLRRSEGGVPITCPVTLEGSFLERTLTKVTKRASRAASRELATRRTAAKVSATILAATLPWEVTYQSFTGTLPNDNRRPLCADRRRPSRSNRGSGIVCLARTSSESPAAGEASREAGGNITSLTTDSSLADTDHRQRRMPRDSASSPAAAKCSSRAAPRPASR